MPNTQARSLFPIEPGRNGLLVVAARAPAGPERRRGRVPGQIRLLAALSALDALAGGLATMLLPHTVANLLLACVPFAPDLATAVVLLLLRQTVSKIDVPARQAFTAAVVPPGQRTAAASMTNLARSVAVSVGQRRSLGSRVGSAYMRGQPRPAASGRSS
ncbi:hypothetical protein ACIBQ6_02540 [Nonomuraea sp. NPDC049655]|uniref:hypothetical protein n=1 Tax=Nonomuraea sp. NPDC049655 TaxID=3364355 RepID=UPI0037A5DCF5